MSDRIRCSHCNGTGRRLLTGVYKRTLDALRRHGEEISGADLARVVGCKATAMNNRLASLERMKLAASRRDGRVRLYVARRRP